MASRERNYNRPMTVAQRRTLQNDLGYEGSRQGMTMGEASDLIRKLKRATTARFGKTHTVNLIKGARHGWS